MNFFDPECQEAPITAEAFGLCEGKNGSKAYTDLHNPQDWVAKVANNRRLELTFTAVDKCVIKDNEHTGRGRCDGILASDEHLYFIELKDQGKNWKPHAIEQLESTIRFFKDRHDISRYKRRKAFVCNKEKRHFQEIDNETNLRFWQSHGVRLDIQADVIVV